MDDSDGNNNLTPPKLLKKKITPPPSPYIARQQSKVTNPISINVTSPNGNLFNFDNIPITPKRVQELGSGFIKPKTPKTLGKVKEIIKEKNDLLDELIDVKGQLNASKLEFEELSEQLKKIKQDLEDEKSEKETLNRKLELAMKQLAEQDEEILALKKSQKVELLSKPNLKRKSVSFNVTSTKKSRKSINLKMRSSMNLNASLKIKSDSSKRGSTVTPNWSKMLADERTRVEELTRELKKYQEEAKQFKAAPVPTFTENSVKPTRTTILRQQSLRIKKK